jgi:hypothetical protein
VFDRTPTFRRTLHRYEGVSKSFRTESITKYTLTTINTRLEATQRVTAAKLTRLTHKIQLHLMAESCTISSSRSRWPVRKLLDTPSYMPPSSAPFTSPWRWRQQGRPKLWYPTSTLHGVTTQKTSVWIILGDFYLSFVLLFLYFSSAFILCISLQKEAHRNGLRLLELQQQC